MPTPRTTRKRLPGSDRKRAILEAVLPVFAAKGVDGARSRELAQAAGVSEALLYKHFPSKEALYRALGSHHMGDRELHPGFDRIAAMPPSTARLVLTIQFLVAHVLDRADDAFPRLMTHSLLGDGRFARTVLRSVRAELEDFFAESLAAAAAAGDLLEDRAAGALDFWLVQQLAYGARMFSLAGPAVVPHGRRREAVIDETVRFTLRGIGLRPEAIRHHYDPRAWRRLRAAGARPAR
jgi:AcrR family transcriptional regulator